MYLVSYHAFCQNNSSCKKIGLNIKYSLIYSWLEVFLLEHKILIFHEFKGEKFQTSSREKILKVFIKHCLKHINGKKEHKKKYFIVMYT